MVARAPLKPITAASTSSVVFSVNVFVIMPGTVALLNRADRLTRTESTCTVSGAVHTPPHGRTGIWFFAAPAVLKLRG